MRTQCQRGGKHVANEGRGRTGVELVPPCSQWRFLRTKWRETLFQFLSRRSVALSSPLEPQPGSKDGLTLGLRRVLTDFACSVGSLERLLSGSPVLDAPFCSQKPLPVAAHSPERLVQPLMDAMDSASPLSVYDTWLAAQARMVWTREHTP